MIFRGTVAIVMLMLTAAIQPVLGQDTYVLVITGLGGDLEFREKFWGQVGIFRKVAEFERLYLRR